MKPRKRRDLKNALQKKGFVLEERHHSYLFLHVRGKKTVVRTKISQGSGEYGSSLLGRIAAQLHLSSKQLDDLLDCPMGHLDYVNHLVVEGKVRLDPAHESERQKGRQAGAKD